MTEVGTTGACRSVKDDDDFGVNLTMMVYVEREYLAGGRRQWP